MKILLSALLLLGYTVACLHASAQTTGESCKVLPADLQGSYEGACKNGLADGQGTARGLHRYTGQFKKGKPDGKGKLEYGDSAYYEGQFQDGIKEGKGEEHHLLSSKRDSVLTGYWSADEYRGRQYVTYSFSTTEQFDQTSLSPSPGTGNTVTIELSTTSGSPNGSGPNGFVMALVDLTSPTGSIVKRVSKFESAFKASYTYELVGFPCKLFGTLMNGNTITVELYKAANWKIRLFKNQ